MWLKTHIIDTTLVLKSVFLIRIWKNIVRIWKKILVQISLHPYTWPPNHLWCETKTKWASCFAWCSAPLVLSPARVSERFENKPITLSLCSESCDLHISIPLFFSLALRWLGLPRLSCAWSRSCSHEDSLILHGFQAGCRTCSSALPPALPDCLQLVSSLLVCGKPPGSLNLSPVCDSSSFDSWTSLPFFSFSPNPLSSVIFSFLLPCLLHITFCSPAS